MKMIIKLKRTFLLLALPVLLFRYGHAHGLYDQKTDTIIMDFGNNSRILILVEGPEDLKFLQNYDLNKMLRDISISIDSTSTEADYLTIRDERGDRYLRDTTIIVREEKEIVREDTRRKESINLQLGNYQVEADNIDDLEDELDDFDPLDMSDFKKSERIERRSWGTRHTFNIELGLNNWLENGDFPDANNAQYTVKPWGSWFVGLSSTHKTSIGGPLFVEWGGHFTWFNWKFEDANTRVTKEATGTVFSADNSVNGIKSKLSTTYINAHFIPMLDFSYGSRKVKTYEKGSLRVTRYKKRGFRIGGGVYGGYRLGSRSKAVFKDVGDREKDKERSNFFMNNFRYGIRGQAGYKGFDFFVNYDLNHVFSNNRGPSLNAISFGVIL